MKHNFSLIFIISLLLSTLLYLTTTQKPVPEAKNVVPTTIEDIKHFQPTNEHLVQKTQWFAMH